VFTLLFSIAFRQINKKQLQVKIMKSKWAHFLLIIGIVFSFYSNSSAQNAEIDTTAIYIVTKTNNQEYIGKLLQDDGREILLLTESMGKIYIPKSEVKSIKKVENPNKLKDGQYLGDNPFNTRYYFTTNALPIAKGDHYVMTHLYGPEVHFSIHNRFSLGIMSTWIASPFAVAAKFALTENESGLNVAVGSIVGTTGYINNFRGYGGLHWGMLTLGDKVNNLTFSFGYGYLQTGSLREKAGTYISPNYPSPNSPSPMATSSIFSIAGIFKISSKVSMIFDSMVLPHKAYNKTEEYIYDDINDPLKGNIDAIRVSYQKYSRTFLYLMPGMRFQTSDDKAFQVALAGVRVFKSKKYNGNQSFPVPMVSWFKKF
jgi:hypothetical protein